MEDNTFYPACRFCGQYSNQVQFFGTMEEATTAATAACDCPDAKQYRIKREIAKQREDALCRAKERIDTLFGEASVRYGFTPLSEDIQTFLYDTTARVYDEALKSATLAVNGMVKMTVSKNNKGVLNIARTNTLTIKEEV